MLTLYCLCVGVWAWSAGGGRCWRRCIRCWINDIIWHLSSWRKGNPHGDEVWLDWVTWHRRYGQHNYVVYNYGLFYVQGWDQTLNWDHFLADIWGLSAFVKASKQSVPSKVCTHKCVVSLVPHVPTWLVQLWSFLKFVGHVDSPVATWKLALCNYSLKGP